MPPPPLSDLPARVSFGVYSHGTRRRVFGGALPSGASVQDAEMVGIFVLLRDVWLQVGEGGTPGRVLILVDCHSVLVDIEWARRAGSLRALRKRNRRQLLERIVALCNSPRIQRVVFQWVRGHRGILPNQYTDAIATAHLNDAPIDLQILIGQPDSESLMRQSSSSAQRSCATRSPLDEPAMRCGKRSLATALFYGWRELVSPDGQLWPLRESYTTTPATRGRPTGYRSSTGVASVSSHEAAPTGRQCSVKRGDVLGTARAAAVPRQTSARS